MKSTIYQYHPRASAGFAYRQLLHWKRGDPGRRGGCAQPHAESRTPELRPYLSSSGI